MGLFNTEDRIPIDYGKPIHEVFLDVVKAFYALPFQALHPHDRHPHHHMSGQGSVTGVLHTQVNNHYTN
jgi:hypothetical protein